jgi:hypothetical protein
MKRISLALILAAAAASAFAAGADFKALLTKIDQMADFGKQDYTAVYSITSQKPDEKPTNTEIKLYRRDELDQFVITIRKPKEDYGKGYLKQGDTVLFYDPAAGEPVPASTKKSVGSSDAQNGDFKKYTFADDYEVVASSEATVSGVKAWVLNLKAKTKDVSYEKIKLTIRQDMAMPLIEEDYASSGDWAKVGLMRTTKYALSYTFVPEVKKYVPNKIKIVDNFNVGNQSLLEISEISVGKLDDSIFKPEYLKSAR